MARRRRAGVISRPVRASNAESSEEDDQGISPTRSRTASVARPRRSARHAGAGSKRADPFSGGLDALPVRKSRRTLPQTRRKTPSPHRAPSGEDGDHPGEEDEPDDQDAVPRDPVFFANINQAINPKAATEKETLKQTADQNPPPQSRRKVYAPFVEDRADEIPGSEPETETADGQRNTRERSNTGAEPSLFFPHPSSHDIRQEDGQKRKSRNKAKPAYGSEGYRQPRQRSEELGSEAIAVVASQPGPRVEKRHPPSKPYLQSVIAQPTNTAQEGGHDEGLDDKTGEGNGEIDPNDFPADDSNDTSAAEDSRLFTNPAPDQSLAVGEDSLPFEAPRESAELVRVTLKSKSLKDMLSRLGPSAWTGDGAAWHEDFLSRGQDVRKEQWLRRHTIGFKASPCRKLLQYLHHLWECFREMPKAPDFSAQKAFMRAHEEDIRKSIRIINSSIEKISDRQLPREGKPANDEQRPGWAIETVKWLRRKLIPMLVLLLQEVFMLGGQSRMESEPRPLDEGEFTQPALELLLRITGWTLRLTKVLNLDMVAYPPTPVTDSFAEVKRLKMEARQRSQFSTQLNLFKANLDSSLDDLDELINGPQRRLEAMQRDRQAKMERERKESERRLAEGRQMQLFIASTQKTGTSMTSSQMIQDDYYEKHGFYYWEDEQLLKLIRDVPNPDYAVLEPMFVNRSSRELKLRAKELKATVRAKYEAANMTPPLWCYS